jgi:sugar fermentation stimulation protein A
MQFAHTLATGTLIRRYKRFFTDVRMDDGTELTAHVANTGSMSGCAVPGSKVALSHHPGRGRKLEWSLELVKISGTWVCINTMHPNRIVREAVASGRIGPLRGHPVIRPEVRWGPHSRLDLLLEGPRGRAWVEVKNVTLAEGRTALFPDAVTDRGAKHLDDLMEIRRLGDRAVIFFVVNRSDCTSMSPADAIDPRYGEKLREAVASGVEALAYRTRSSLRGIVVDRKLPVRL